VGCAQLSIEEEFMAEAEQRTRQTIKVRQVTDYQASWTEMGRETSRTEEGHPGTPGAFTVQLILDNGAEEYVIQPDVDDMKMIRKLLDKSGTLAFDLERKVLLARDFPLGQ
jgi:hypothetical protein